MNCASPVRSDYVQNNRGLLYDKNWMFSGQTVVVGGLCGTVVERRSLAGELSLSCARPAGDG